MMAKVTSQYVPDLGPAPTKGSLTTDPDITALMDDVRNEIIVHFWTVDDAYRSHLNALRKVWDLDVPPASESGAFDFDKTAALQAAIEARVADGEELDPDLARVWASLKGIASLHDTNARLRR